MAMAPASTNADSAAALSRRLQDPGTIAALVSLLDHVELLAVLVEGLDEFVARTEVIGDSLISGIAEVRETVQRNPELADAKVDVASVLTAAGKVARSRLVDTAVRLAEADFAGPEAVDQVGVLARGLVQGGRDFAIRPTEVHSVVGLLRLLKDPDVSRAVNYFATVAGAIGRELAVSGTGVVAHP